jgi:hypothetical protein
MTDMTEVMALLADANLSEAERAELLALYGEEGFDMQAEMFATTEVDTTDA